MPVLVLSPEELSILSSYAVRTPNDISPMKRLYVRGTFDFKDDALQSSIKNFLKHGFIKPDKQGNISLAEEIEPVMWVLNRPQQVIAFKRLSMVNMGETFFCRNGTVWVENSVSGDGVVETVTYPYLPEDIVKWFCSDFIKNTGFCGKGLAERTLELSAGETVVLFLIQHIYKKRVAVKKPLEKDDMWINIHELAGQNDLENARGNISLILPLEQIYQFISDKEKLQQVVEETAGKGLLEFKYGNIIYSDFSKAILDPGKIMDVMVVKNLGSESTVKTLNILPEGYMLVEPVDGKPAFKLRTFPADMDKKLLLKELTALEGEDGAKSGGRAKVAETKKADAAQTQEKTAAKKEGRYCIQCGTFLDADSYFCYKCGTRAN